NFILDKICPPVEGKRAGQFLLEFTRMQVDYWVRDFVRTHNVSLELAYPHSCARLRCDNFATGNCMKRKRMGNL
ncbi:unnamed protein product, partial [Cylicocyclus nassatus]